MSDVSGYFGKIWETSEGWKSNCPKCGNLDRTFNWNTDKGVGCCFHASCAWYFKNGGVTAGRLHAFFSRAGIHHVVPEVIAESKEADVELPEEFQLIRDLKSELRSSLYAYLSRRHIPRRVVDRTRLGYCESGKRWGYIILPVFDDEGKVVYWQGRRFKNREPKFYNPKSSKKSDLVYCVSRGTKPNRIVVVESVMNALTLETMERGRTAVMAILGKTISEAQRDKILWHEKYVKEFVVALDGDARRDAVELAEKFQGIFPCTKIANVPNGEDINSLGREKAWWLVERAELFNARNRTEFMMREV